ncbi:recQ-mediated genome instability protein 1-like isoform X2 [Prorops nasuta]
MNDSWLAECVEYYLNNETNATDDEILLFVKTQWRLNDLRETNNEHGSLPKNLAQQKMIILPGAYILQVDKMYDIGAPKYKQLEKIRSISTANIEVTESENAKPWEPVKKRMYQLFLTDGVQDILAIEYSELNFSTVTLLPGYKLLIKGPVRCRRGVILLEQKNFQEIGGEVESMLVTNAEENVLAAALNLPLNEDPYKPTPENSQSVQNHIQDYNSMDDELASNLESLNTIEENSCKQTTTNHINKERSRPTNVAVSNQENDLLNLEDNVLEMIDLDFNEPITEKPSHNSKNLNEKKSNEISISNSNSWNYNINKINSSQAHHNSTKGTKCNLQQDIDSPMLSHDFPDDDFDFNEFEIQSNIQTPQAFTSTKINTENKKEKQNYGNLPSASAVTIKKTENSINGFKRSAQSVVSPPPSCSTSKIRCVQTTPKISKNQHKKTQNRKISEFLGKKPDPPIPKICDFICHLVKDPVINVIVKTVKGRVIKHENLVKRSNLWHLDATITDETATLDIMFSSQLLEEMLGFSVQEFAEKKKLKKTNPKIDQELRLTFRNVEKQIKNLDALLKLEFSPNTKPKLLTINQLTESDKNIITKSLKLLKVQNK